MNSNIDFMEKQNPIQQSNNRITGLFLLVGGVALLAYKMGAPIPYWLFSWPMILIVIGLLIAIKHRFRNNAGLVMIVIGAIFLSEQVIPGVNLHEYIWPAVIIGIGLLFILRPHTRRGAHNFAGFGNEFGDKNFEPATIKANQTDGEFIDATSIFGGVKKKILSKNFQGGDITCFMGGAEFDLTQSDIQKPVVIDVTQVFGGTKLLVPANWDVKSEVVAIFSGVEDKRPVLGTAVDPNKILIIRGTSIFAGIEIKSY